MKLGANNRKMVGYMAVAVVLGGYSLYTNVLSGPAVSPTRPVAAPSLAPPPGLGTPSAAAPNIRRANSGRINKGDEFHPTLRSKRPEERVDPATIDPTLRLDLLAKVQAATAEGGSRNIFQFGPPPALKATVPLGAEPVVHPKGVYGPQLPPPKVEAAKEALPPPQPINLKYYGYSTARAGGRKTAFFLDGEEILVALEGDVVKKRYKVVRIGVNSVVMEDTVSNRQQSLPLADEVAGVG